ncbi:MAG: hypothetical protein ACTSO3_11770 [Candidatus Heimdallarchaeaceae archaeon]
MIEFDINVLKPAAVLIVTPILRSVAGWATKAFEDGKISRFELKQLSATIVRVGLIGVSAYVGLNCAGIDVPAVSAALGAIIADKLFKALKENKNLTKR